MTLGSEVSTHEIINKALRDKFDSIDVFIHADFETRRERAVENHGIEEKKSAKTVKKIDKERTSFYNFYTNMKWADARDFDLCINTSKITIDEAVEIILETVKRHFIDDIKYYYIIVIDIVLEKRYL